jgi:predicted DsbA family dithiol-disulfide isomerase
MKESGTDKMIVEVWSDVMCPFCYIGKRKFEAALARFEHRDHVQLVWKSYQLAPDMKTDPTLSINDYLAAHKGITAGEAEEMHAHVTEMAAAAGLEYNFNRTVVANSFDAHRFIHFAKQAGRQNEAEETLFHAYFTDGKNIADLDTLIHLGTGIGLDAAALRSALENGSFADDVRADIYEARQVRVQGVPFFLFDGKYTVQGARDSEVFLQTLEKSYAGWKRPPSV